VQRPRRERERAGNSPWFCVVQVVVHAFRPEDWHARTDARMHTSTQAQASTDKPKGEDGPKIIGGESSGDTLRDKEDKTIAHSAVASTFRTFVRSTFVGLTQFIPPSNCNAPSFRCGGQSGHLRTACRDEVHLC